MSGDTAQQWMALADENVEVASRLVAQGHIRVAVSRVYYAMFYAATALLAARGLEYSKHGAVIGAFGREFAKTGELPSRYHTWLGNAFELRSAADYEIASRFTQDNANEYVSRARDFIQAARTYLDTHPPSD